MKKFNAAVIQMDSTDQVDQNLETLAGYIEEAAARGAKLVAMPENCNYVGRNIAACAEENSGRTNLPDDV